MQDGKIVVARLALSFDGNPSIAQAFLGLDPNKYRLICIYLTRRCEGSDIFAERGCNTYYLSKGRHLKTFDFGIFRKLVKILKNENVSVLHCHRHKPTVYGAAAAVLAKVPVVVSHVHGISRTKNFVRRLTNKLIFKKINRIVTVGDATRDDVVATNPGLEPSKVFSIGNCIDFNVFSAGGSLTKAQAKERIGIKPSTFVFGTVARLAPHKGQVHFIRAFAEVKKSLPDSALVFVGDGRIREELEAEAAKTGFAKDIMFLGQRSDTPELISAMDCFAMPSVGSEGLPKALMEAMAGMVPCIGSRISGIPEVLGDGKLGILVEPGNERELAETMLDIWRKGNGQFDDMLKAAKQSVYERYSFGLFTRKLDEIYTEEIAKSREVKLKGSGI